MHLFRLWRSFDARVDNTRNSILDASRYFCTERIIFTAHRVFRWLSYASTTFPNVPCPRSRMMESAKVRKSNPPQKNEKKRKVKAGSVKSIHKDGREERVVVGGRRKWRRISAGCLHRLVNSVSGVTI
jgi:hypothetical protein